MLLNESLGFVGRIIGSETLESFHILFQTEHLRLETVAQCWQGVADMVGQLLIQCGLQIGRAHSIGHVSIGWMTKEEFPLTCYGRLNILSAINILLTPVHDAHIAWGGIMLLKLMDTHTHTQLIEMNNKIK